MILCCRGIMNGIDTQKWNPETDRYLPEDARYSASTVSSGKAAAKALFQELKISQVNGSNCNMLLA